jgi:hypothetical protein
LVSFPLLAFAESAVGAFTLLLREVSGIQAQTNLVGYFSLFRDLILFGFWFWVAPRTNKENNQRQSKPPTGKM